MKHWIDFTLDHLSSWWRRPLFRISLALFVILAIGIFVRTYNFHEWLHFGSDQARDVMLVGDVVEGKKPLPLLGMEAGNTRFDLGPAYYYFQIFSAKIFGVSPETMAYPDVLISILTIPLAYFLFRKLFDRILSLSLVGLYTISFYVIEYSRFAWNPNVIPFFAGMFLFSVTEFLKSGERTKWRWIIALGIAIGIGVQLHTILLFLFPIIFLGIVLFFLKKRIGTLLRVGSVIGIVFVLNIPQVLSEMRTNGENTRLFLNAFTDRSKSGESRFFENLKIDILCHAQANSHILSARGQHGSCNFLELLEHPKRGSIDRILSFGGIAMSVVFSVIGYGLLIFFTVREVDTKKKNFFLVVTLYAALSFVILFSVIRDAPLRYFIHVTFIPFILLGLILTQIRCLFPKWYKLTGILVFVVLAFLNGRAIAVEAKQLASGLRGDSGFVVLGDVERMVAYMREQSGEWKEANLAGGTAYFSTYYKSLKYIAAQEGIDIHLVKRNRPPISKTPYFFIGNHSNPKKPFNIDGYDLVNQQDFGHLGIYQLRSVKYRTSE